MFNKKEKAMTTKEQDVWLVIKRTFWSSDSENWFDVQAIARTNENAETKKSALETLEEDKKVSYIIIQTKRIVKVESEESNDEIPF
jgi:protein associated with RNAse G/E|tara:strand:+ start:127 stop:384 length:258 start_codon:yes stop_codon:yes gene_type:complete